MAKKDYFMDDTVYSADDVNAVFARMINAGVSMFDESANDPLQALNSAVSNIINSGVMTSDALKISISDGKIYAEPGCAFLPDGSCTIITEKYEICDAPSSYGHLFLYRDTMNNRIDFEFRETAEGAGLYLAAGSHSDGFSDFRVPATLKASNQNTKTYIEVEPYGTAAISSYTVVHEQDINVQNPTYVIAYINTTGITATNGEHRMLTDGEAEFVYKYSSGTVYNAYKIKIENSKLKIYRQKAYMSDTNTAIFVVL